MNVMMKIKKYVSFVIFPSSLFARQIYVNIWNRKSYNNHNLTGISVWAVVNTVHSGFTSAIADSIIAVSLCVNDAGGTKS